MNWILIIARNNKYLYIIKIILPILTATMFQMQLLLFLGIFAFKKKRT